MTTRLEYRTNLTNKLLALEDGSYGDFEYSTAEMDTFLDLSVARLFPAVYRRVASDDIDVVGYGSALQGYVADDAIVYERVFMVEDADEYRPLTGWQIRPDRIIGIDATNISTVRVYWIDGFTIDPSDLGTNDIPDVYEPLINLGALIEALEARQDTGVRGEPQPTGVFQETQLLDRLKPRYDSLKQELAMSLPGMVL